MSLVESVRRYYRRRSEEARNSSFADEPPNPDIWRNIPYLTDNTAWFLPPAPDIVIPQDTDRLELQRRIIHWVNEDWLGMFGSTHPSTQDILAESTVELLDPDTAPESTEPRRKKSYEQWHAETVALLAEQEARHE